MFSGGGLVAKSCPALVTPWTASPPGSSVHGILQARILEWVAISLLQGIFPTQGLDLGLPHWSFPGGSAGKECMLGAGALGRPRGMEWGGRREEGSGWGTHVYLWRIHFDIWQN